VGAPRCIDDWQKMWKKENRDRLRAFKVIIGGVACAVDCAKGRIHRRCLRRPCVAFLCRC
jgi:chloramphenicol 3-O-phosphotransferase